jgi:uncharacterized protein YqgV (UPF0045/DUF77 family)
MKFPKLSPKGIDSLAQIDPIDGALIAIEADRQAILEDTRREYATLCAAMAEGDTFDAKRLEVTMTVLGKSKDDVKHDVAQIKQFIHVSELCNDWQAKETALQADYDAKAKALEQARDAVPVARQAAADAGNKMRELGQSLAGREKIYSDNYSLLEHFYAAADLTAKRKAEQARTAKQAATVERNVNAYRAR